MEWYELYTREKQPSPAEITEYIGDASNLWLSLTGHIEDTYKAKPKYAYSGCSGKPGWNVKYQKSGKTFGTFYPEKDSFSVLTVISYKLDPSMELILPNLSPDMANLYKNAEDYMKMGKWMMFQITDKTRVEDYKKIIYVKATG